MKEKSVLCLCFQWEPRGEIPSLPRQKSERFEVRKLNRKSLNLEKPQKFQGACNMRKCACYKNSV